MMDSLAHRFSSRRWPMMMQAQRRVKNTHRLTMVFVLRYKDDKRSGDGNKAIMSIEVGWVFVLSDCGDDKEWEEW